MAKLSDSNYIHDGYFKLRWVYEWRLAHHWEMLGVGKTPCAVVWYIVSGNRMLSFDGQDPAPIKEGDLIVIPPGKLVSALLNNKQSGEFHYLALGSEVKLGYRDLFDLHILDHLGEKLSMEQLAGNLAKNKKVFYINPYIQLSFAADSFVFFFYFQALSMR